jgi:hypothetical protein
MSATAIAGAADRSAESGIARRGGVDGTRLILAGLVAVAAALRFADLGHQSFWYDEGFTVTLVHHSPGAMLGLLPRTELTPPLYYCVAWVWVRIFGYGETGLRSLSAFAGVATIPVIYGVGAKLISRRAGLVAAAIAACNPLLIWYSQEARSYAVLILLTSLSLLAFAHARSPRPPKRWLIAWSLVAGLLLATHYYAVLVVAPQAVGLLWVHWRDRRVLLAIAAVGAFGLALLPIALSQRPHASWIAWWPLDLRLSQIGPQYLLGTGAPARTILKIAGAAAVLLAAVLLVRRSDASERRGALLAGALALAGFLLALLLIVAGVDELITRNLIVVLIPLIVLIGAGLGARRAGWLGLAGTGVLCAIGIVAAIGVAVDWRYQRPQWRALATSLASTHPVSADRAILIENYPGILPLQLYVPGLRFMNPRGARIIELDVVGIDGPGFGWFCWWGSACNLSPATVDTSVQLRGFHPYGPVLRAGQFSIFRLRSAAAVRVTQQQISRSLRKRNFFTYGLLIQRPPRAT